MIWTHIFDLLIKIGTFILIILLFLLIPGLIDHPFIGIIFILVLWVLSIVFVAPTPGSWLYCRIRLKMPISLSQASKLNRVLSPNPFRFNLDGQKWLPLLEVLEVESEKRYEEAMRVSNNWIAEREQKDRQKREEFSNASPASKTLTILIIGFIIFCFIAAFTEIPPANYFIRFYCRIFDTDRYPVMLISCLMILTIVGPIALFKKLIQRG